MQNWTELVSAFQQFEASRPSKSQLQTYLGDHPWEFSKFLYATRRSPVAMIELIRETPGAQYLMHIHSVKNGCDMSRLAVERCEQYKQDLNVLAQDNENLFSPKMKELELHYTKEIYSFILITISMFKYADKFVKKYSLYEANSAVEKFSNSLSSTKALRNTIAHHGSIFASGFIHKDFDSGDEKIDFKLNKSDFIYTDIKEKYSNIILKSASLTQFIKEIQKQSDNFYDEYSKILFENLNEPIRIADKYCFWTEWMEMATDALFNEKSGSHFPYLRKFLYLS